MAFRGFLRLRRRASLPLSKHSELLLKSLCPEPADQAKTSELASASEHHIHQRHKANPFK